MRVNKLRIGFALLVLSVAMVVPVQVAHSGPPTCENEFTPGDDVIIADSSKDNEILCGGEGNDRFVPAQGPGDEFYGGPGTDKIDYSSLPPALTETHLDTNTFIWDTGSGSDVGSGNLYETEDVKSAAGNDYVWGDEKGNRFDAGSGRDQFFPNGGDDKYFGGSGKDWVLYSTSPNGVNVNLKTGVAKGFGEDTLSGVEFVRGSNKNDVITGKDGQDNSVHAFAGNDRIFPGSGPETVDGGPGNDFIMWGDGNKYITGGSGTDTLSFAKETEYVYLIMAYDSYEWKPNNYGSFSGLENIDGSRHSDTIYGDGGANKIKGMGGHDTLYGGGGKDKLYGGSGGDTLDGQGGSDFGDGGPMLDNCYRLEQRNSCP
jgi:Ca2+-binding RTX toxin-like protein